MPSAPTPPEAAVATAVSDLAREHSGRVLAVVANRFGDLDLADEAVQQALIRAAERWGHDDLIPDNPGGWLMTVAKRIAIDTLRSRDSAQRRLTDAAPELTADHTSEATTLAGHDLVVTDETAPIDDQLRLILLCCHPALSQPAQVALTLRLVAGLTTEEIAAAFLVPTPTIAQRVTRAKRKIRDAAIPLAIPPDLADRLGMVRSVLYLTFNEGYLSRSGSEGAIRHDLCETALRVTRSLQELVPDDPETGGLLALELFHYARRSTRFTLNSELVQLGDQDRAQWDRGAIAEANAELGAALALRRPGSYQMQALIASYHANALDVDATDWGRIEGLYSQLRAMEPSPVIALNHAVAIAKLEGAQAGLAAIDAIDGLGDYHLLHSTRAWLLDEIGDRSAAQIEWKRALELAANPAERNFIENKLQ